MTQIPVAKGQPANDICSVKSETRPDGTSETYVPEGRKLSISETPAHEESSVLIQTTLHTAVVPCDCREQGSPGCRLGLSQSPGEDGWRREGGRGKEGEEGEEEEELRVQKREREADRRKD